MIAPETIAEIRRLLAEKRHSQREIARRTGVCRGSVGSIASGRRRDGDDPMGSREDEFPVPSGPPARCPGCGAMVYLPCVLCRVQSKRRKGPRVIEQAADTRLGGIARPKSPAGASRPLRGSTEAARERNRGGDKETGRQGDSEAMTDDLRQHRCLRRRSRRDPRRGPAAVSPPQLVYAADRRGRAVALRPCRDGRLVERPADVRRNDLRRRPGATAVEYRRALAGRLRRVSGQCRAAAVLPPKGLGGDDRHHGQALWQAESLPGRLAAPADFPVPGSARHRRRRDDRLAAVLFAGGFDGLPGRRRRSGAQPGRPSDRAGRLGEKSVLSSTGSLSEERRGE